MINITHGELLNIQKRLQTNLNCLDDLINNHGKVVALHKGENRTEKDLVNDYFFFCLTKGVRSLLAVDILLTEGLFEDSSILMRSSYECYLNGSYVSEHPEKVDDLLVNRVGLWTGSLKHPLNDKGNPKRNKVIIPETGETINYGVTISEMAKNTSSKNDALAHIPFYKFLSEFVHVHIKASGAYRTSDDKRYSIQGGYSSSYYTMTNSLYISWLLLDSAIDYIHENGADVFDYEHELDASREILISTIKELGFSEELKGLKNSIISRLCEGYYT